MSAIIPALIELAIKGMRRRGGGGGGGGGGGYAAGGGKGPRDEDAYSWKLFDQRARKENIGGDMDGIIEATNTLKQTNAQVEALQSQVNQILGGAQK